MRLRWCRSGTISTIPGGDDPRLDPCRFLPANRLLVGPDLPCGFLSCGLFRRHCPLPQRGSFSTDSLIVKNPDCFLGGGPVARSLDQGNSHRSNAKASTLSGWESL